MRRWSNKLLNLLWYAAMAPLEVYGRIAGVYRVGCEAGEPATVNTGAAESRAVICFGDSLTEGFGAGQEHSYPAHLDSLLSPMGFRVVNVGRSGDTAADGLARIEQDVLSRTEMPCIVVVGFGGNDLMQGRRVEEMIGDLEEIVRRLHATGCLVILLELRGSWLYKVDYHTPFCELSSRMRCGLVPVCMDGIWGVPWRMSDAAHPNRRGYRILAERVARELERYKTEKEGARLGE